MPDSGKPNITQPLPQIGSYRLIQQLGSGGMNSVFDDSVLTKATVPPAGDRPGLVPSRAIDPPRSGTSPVAAPSPGKQTEPVEVDLAEPAALDEDPGPRGNGGKAPVPAAPSPGAYALMTRKWPTRSPGHPGFPRRTKSP